MYYTTKWRNFEKLLDADEDGEITEKEIEDAKEILHKAKMKEIKREALRNMDEFKSNL